MPLSDIVVSPPGASGEHHHVTHHSAMALLREIGQQYPDAPFLALGQTVFWDEPTKAVWRRLLDMHMPGRRMVTGVHDTDYFAKLSSLVHSEEKYAIVPHDDGATRDLWSAAGELSALFGSESIPSRQMFLDRGVPFDWLTQYGPGDKASRYAALTSAWGWRGLVRTDQHNVVACDIPAVEIAGAVKRLLDWGLGESLLCIAGSGGREEAERLIGIMRGWIDEFLADCNESCRLTELYQTLLPRFYQLLLGQPANIETTASTELFEFNTDTASRARFRVLEPFLNPTTRPAACRAYNLGVRGSGIYELDHFGDGAIPFDLVVPHQGRGTIFIRPSRILAQLGGNDPIEIARGSFPTLQEFAAAVEQKFGPRVALVGKAVVLADMIAAEHLVLFHESASGYTGLTRKFNEGLAKSGVHLDLKPIIRVSYPTWDALDAVPEDVAFTLPDHLAAAFGSREITGKEFAAGWRNAVDNQRKVLTGSRSMSKLRDLLTYLDGQDPSRNTVRGFEALVGGPIVDSKTSAHDPGPSKAVPCWCDLLADYEHALHFLRDNAEKSAIMRSRIDEHREELRIWQKERMQLEARMGEDWRASLLPLMHKLADATGQDAAKIDAQIQRQMSIRATAFEEPIAILKERIATTKTMIASFRRERKRLERSPEALKARATIARIMREAQAARLMLVRNAYLAVDGLTHTHVRPTSWWFPLVDPSGRWFNAMVAGTQARFEYLWPE